MDFSDFSLDVASLRESPKPETGETYDVLILGGGPASISAGEGAKAALSAYAYLVKKFQL